MNLEKAVDHGEHGVTRGNSVRCKDFSAHQFGCSTFRRKSLFLPVPPAFPVVELRF